jgi:hypothetical protein
MTRRIAIALAVLAATLTLAGSASAGLSDGVDASPATFVASTAGLSDGVD